MSLRKAGAPMWTVAIDGPSGTGKSTVSRLLAQRFGGQYLDTGAMYRAVTWAALQDSRIDVSTLESAPDEVDRLLENTTLSISTNPAAPAIAVNGVRSMLLFVSDG